MADGSNHTTERYYLYFGNGHLCPSNVFFEIEDEAVARQLCDLFAREYTVGGEISFHYQAVSSESIAEEIRLGEALDELVMYDDPYPGIYDPSPPRSVLDRAEYSRRAGVWFDLLQRRVRNRGRPESPTVATESQAAEPSHAVAGDRCEAEESNSELGDLPDLDKIPPMPEADRRNSGLILLLMFAQAYYKLVESSVSLATWVTALDLELNHSYLWTVQSLANLLKHHEDLQDFPEPFEPVLPDLYPSTIGDLEWQDMIAPSVEGFLATVQKYVMAKGCYEPEEKSPAWIMVELFRSSVTRAIESAENYHTRMRKAQLQILGQPVSSTQSTTASSSPRSGNAGAKFSTPTGASWAMVSIKFLDGETVSIKVGDQSGRYLFSEMGMIDGRDKKPTKQWELLQAFARRGGVLTWADAEADRRNQKRREKLAENLKDFFGIAGEPIVLTEDKKGWRAVFAISDT